ncbi:LysR family transcriptional regulator [Harryflintia acetispora]|uniref:LysR family transcriptional regulator n=1 Tax=Harryflintia acetispora TaxID=1849041 RepID=UPI0018979751|nr:LysR family transcriptional regulator [Harryflintia acetispora]
MIELGQLEQLVAVAECGTLSKAAEQLHLSQPALSRSIQKLEEELQVTLFERQKNKLSLNPCGELTVEHAKKVIGQSRDLVERVRAFERRQRTVSVGSCAPAPLWDIVPLLSALYPEMTISSEMKSNDRLLQGLGDGTYQMIVLPEPIQQPGIHCVRYGEEQLYFSLPPAHPLSGAKALHLKDLDGETMLLLSQIGFWHEMHREKMPNTHFLVQEEDFAFNELVRASALPSFTSDLAIKREGNASNRVMIPILDPEAHATFYCLCRADEEKKLSAFFRRIESPAWKPS